MSISGPDAITRMGLEEVVRQMPAAVMVVEATSGRFIHVNEAAREMTERHLGRIIPGELTADWQIFHPDGRPYRTEEWPVVRSITSGEKVIDEEYFNLLPGGRRMIVRCSSSPIYDADGVILAGVLVMDDITEHKRAEDELRYHAGLVENMEDAVIATNERFLVTAWNRGAENLYGWTSDEVLGSDARKLSSWGLSDAERAEAIRTLHERGPSRAERTRYRKDGTPVYVEALNVAIRGERDQVTGFLGIHRDISERKRGEEALLESQRRSEEILESISDDVLDVDREWRFTYVNKRGLAHARKALGRDVTPEELLGMSVWEVAPQLVGGTIYQELHRVMREQRPAEFEAYSETTERWLEIRVYPSEDGLTAYTHDISERKRAEEEVREARRRSETILNSISDEFFTLDREWRFTYINERGLAAGQQIPGRELTAAALLGESIWELFPQLIGTTFEHEAHRAVREQTVVELEYWSPVAGRWVEIRIYPSEVGVSIYLHDISDRRRAEEERERRARQQALVADLGLRALASDELQPLLDDAVGLVARTLDVELVGIAEVLPGEEALLRAGVGWGSGVVGHGTAIARPGSLLGHTVASGEPVVSEDLAADERFQVSALLSEHDAVSGATVVIAGRDKPFGSLGAFSSRHHSFTGHDVSIMQAVANILATAVERSETQERLTEVLEDERRRIARNLHDEALRDLTEALVLAGGARSVSDEPDAASRLAALNPALKRVGEQLRGAIYDLRLGGDEDRPFHELLESLVDVHRAMAVDCEVELEVGDGVPIGRLGATGTEILRVLGEALTNARRHSRARHVGLRVWRSEDRLCGRVSDDGRGFDPAVGSPAVTRSGIKGMRERAGLVHGELDIRSEPEIGTTVRIEVPLPDPGEVAPDRVRVLLVEDHTSVRQAIASAFEREAGFEVVGAASLAEAREMLDDVDVAVLDLGLPDGYGADLIKELRMVNPRAQALVLSAAFDRADIARAVQSGAAGVLNKTADLDDVVDAVRRLRAGETLLPMDEIVELLRFADHQREREHDEREALAELTSREREILQALAEGLDSQRIADRLHVSIHTARNHINNILAKLGVHSQLQALILAFRYDVVKITKGQIPPGN